MVTCAFLAEAVLTVGLAGPVDRPAPTQSPEGLLQRGGVHPSAGQHSQKLRLPLRPVRRELEVPLARRRAGQGLRRSRFLHP